MQCMAEQLYMRDSIVCPAAGDLDPDACHMTGQSSTALKGGHMLQHGLRSKGGAFSSLRS